MDSVAICEVRMNLIERFRMYPNWAQGVTTVLAVSVLVAVWTSCGNVSYSPPPRLAKPRLELKNQNGIVHALVFSSNESWLAAGTDDGTIDLWDPTTGTIVKSLGPHRGKVLALAVSASGGFLASGYADTSIVLWDMSKKVVARELAGQRGAVTDLAFSSDDRWLASSSEDNTVRIWDVSSGEQVRSLEGHTARVNAIAFAPGSALIASASDDATIRIWNVASGTLVKVIAGHKSRVLSLNFSPDGKFLASGGAAQLQLSAKDRTYQLRIWDAKNWGWVHGFSQVMGDVECLAFSPDSKQLAASNGFSTSTEIIRWDTDRWQVVSEWNAHHSNMTALAYSRDGLWLVSAGTDGRIRFWQ